MAYGGSQSWELLCPVCKTFIETNNYDDLQASLDYHYLNVHPKLRGITQSDNNIPVLKDMKYMNVNNVNQPSQECTNYIICPVCDSVVQIFQNSINHCFMEHFEVYHQNVLKFDTADNLSDQRREQSTESFENAENKDQLSDSQNMTSKSWSSNSLVLPSDLEKHRGYIIFNDNHFLCHLCRETLNTQQIVEDHLKTKRHEDNVIIWLKNKLSKHMHSAMEFVSFYGSNLCCNLCRCNIDLNSLNPHETLLNIISHNTDAKHSQTKSHRDPKESNNVGYSILKSVTEKNPLIKEHKDFIETEMEPRLNCKLCRKTIHFSKNYFELEQNFLTHINSILHSKNSKAMTVLQLFREMNGDRDGRHCFSVLNGAINCTQCKCTVMANTEKMLEHCQSYVNVEISQFSETKNKDYAPLTSKKVHMTDKSNLPLDICSETEKKCKILSDSQVNSSHINPTKINRTKEINKSHVKEILHPLQNQFGNITCIAENEDGKLTCLICNCLIQPSTHCVKMHLMGKFHKNKTQCQIKELNTLNFNNGETNQNLNLNNGGTPREPFQDLIEHLFKSLPQRFQEEKDFCTVNLTDGSINCTLCNCKVDPLLIEVHLQKETHLQQKKLVR